MRINGYSTKAVQNAMQKCNMTKVSDGRLSKLEMPDNVSRF